MIEQITFEPYCDNEIVLQDKINEMIDVINRIDLKVHGNNIKDIEQNLKSENELLKKEVNRLAKIVKECYTIQGRGVERNSVNQQEIKMLRELYSKLENQNKDLKGEQATGHIENQNGITLSNFKNFYFDLLGEHKGTVDYKIVMYDMNLIIHEYRNIVSFNYNSQSDKIWLSSNSLLSKETPYSLMEFYNAFVDCTYDNYTFMNTDANKQIISLSIDYVHKYVLLGYKGDE